MNRNHSFQKWNRLIMLLFLLGVLQTVKAQDKESNKVRILVIVDTSEPLIVDYRTVGNTVRSLIFLGSLTDVAITEIRQSSHSKKLRETVGEFDRFPLIKKGVENAFAPQSKYFQVEVTNDASLLKGKRKVDLKAVRALGYPFVLLFDEVFSGLVSAWKLGTLSASTTIRYELIDVNKENTMSKGSLSGWNKAIHDFEGAISDRNAFIQEYEDAVLITASTIYGQLNKDGHLNAMAGSAGLSDYVPSLIYFLDQYAKKFDYKIKFPKGWHEVAMGSKYTKVTEPRNDDKLKFGIRVDIDLLIKELGQDVDQLDAYMAIFMNKAFTAGYSIDTITQIPLSIDSAQYTRVVLNRPNNTGKEVLVFTQFGKEYVAIFSLIFLQDFERFLNKYQGDIEYVITNIEFEAH